MSIVVDIGGSNTRVAPVEGGALGEVRKLKTPEDPREGLRAIAQLAQECAGDTKISALVGGIAGDVISVDGVLSRARNLRSWEGHDVVGGLSTLIAAPVTLINDAAAACLGEATYGAGQGVERVSYLTVSTGVGGALVVHGRVEAAGGVAGVQIDGEDLENLVSGTAVRKKFGIHPKDLDSLEERNKLADTLARGLAALTETWSPDVFVLGGSMIIGHNPIPLERAQETLHTLLADAPRTPAVVMAKLGDSAGLWGGVALLSRANG